MSDTEEKEFSIEGMLDRKREVSETLGFYDEVRPGFLKKMIMSSYKKPFVQKYYLNSVTWSQAEDKFILKWTRRMKSMELTDEEYFKEYEGFLREIKNKSNERDYGAWTIEAKQKELQEEVEKISKKYDVSYEVADNISKEINEAHKRIRTKNLLK